MIYTKVIDLNFFCNEAYERHLHNLLLPESFRNGMYDILQHILSPLTLSVQQIHNTAYECWL